MTSTMTVALTIDVDTAFGGKGTVKAMVFANSLAYSMHSASCEAYGLSAPRDIKYCMMGFLPEGITAAATVTIDTALIDDKTLAPAKDRAEFAGPARRRLADLSNSIAFVVTAPASKKATLTTKKAAMATATQTASSNKDKIMNGVKAVFAGLAKAEGITDWNTTLTAVNAAMEASLTADVSISAIDDGSAPATSGAYTFSLIGLAAAGLALLL